MEKREVRRVTASEIRHDFSETVNRVAYLEEQYVIERRGRALAALIPYALYQKFQMFLESIEDELDANAIAASAGDELIDFDVAVKEIGSAVPRRNPKGRNSRT